jgi:exonuclease 1
MHRVRMLIYFGVTPYLVFDGDNLPSKACTESDRAKRRLESKRKGLELYKANKVSQAYPEFQKSIDVTPYMARQLIEELKKLDIQYVVAPYEADAQLAYLEKKGIIDGILSEDSDLLVYGAKKLITKLDQHGDCIEISRSDFASCRDITLAGFTDAEFRVMAILSGCDYLASINKVGLKTAHTYVRKYKSVERILRMLQFEQKFVVPSGYLEKFYEAERTFLHHRVFCPLQKKLMLSTELEDGMKEEDMPYLGKNVSPATAIGVACGDLDPMTKKQIPMNVAASSRSMPDLHRRRTVASAHDLKPSKSIDNFFKPKRQPLAELDPNSLTPSPSQQRLLNLHRNASWEARPISSAPQLRRTVSVLPDPVHIQTGQPQPRERLSFLERAATLSTFQPPKRTRLCSDVDISPSGKDGQSPFFATKPEPSPSIRKRGKTKKARLSDIEIFSDDSVADIFQDMQAPGSEAVDVSIVPVGQADKGERSTARESSPITPSVTEVCDTPVRQTIQIKQSGISQLTSAVSISIKNDDAEEFQDLIEIHAREVNSFRNTFAYQSSARQAAALQGLSPPSVISQNTEQAKIRIGGPATHNSALADGQISAGEIRSRYTASMHKTFSTQSSYQQAAALKSLGQTQSPSQKVKLGLAALDSAAHLQMQQRPLTPLQQLGQRAFHKTRSPSYNNGTPSAASHGVAVTAAAATGPSVNIVREVRVQGSEDLLVPKSDDEASEVSEIEDVEFVRRNVDLTRFAFTANG